MQAFSTRAAAIAAGMLSILPALGLAQDLARSRYIATSDVLSHISMFAFQERRRSDLILRATPIVSSGEGKVAVQYEDENASIVAEVRRMPRPDALGPYTNYVLWALTPDGRAANKGVLTGPEGGNGLLETTHGASQFTLIVSAEPHFAVTVPSTMIVMYNVADKVRGAETKISSLFERSDYSAMPVARPDNRPIELIQAEYALEIARATDAEEFVPNQLYAAVAKYDAARVAWGSDRSRDRRMAPGLAREAVIAGEDARRSALVARAAAEAQAEREAAAEAAAAAERERTEALLRAERERDAEERARAAEVAAEAARIAKAEADAARMAAAADAAAKARAEARAELLNRLSSVLPTRETHRGLVSEIGGVQFATATATLNSPARETLARFSGIVASYPELSFSIEGHTDNVGSDATNDELSLRRAISVRDYLTGLGVDPDAIRVNGHGSRSPIADNSNAQGRARNRRVEIVISGGLLAPGNR